jgi:hypothetical protein
MMVDHLAQMLEQLGTTIGMAAVEADLVVRLLVAMAA